MSGRPARELNEDPGPGPLREGVYENLYDLLRFDKILKCIEPDRSRWSRLHLILVPDGLLFQFCLPAAYCRADDQRLYQQVCSVRYALSLRTLELQQQIQNLRASQEREDYRLRGVFFANPSLGKDPLPGVITEVDNVLRVTGLEHWWVHGERGHDQADRATLQSRHASGNVLLVSSHGGWIHDLPMPGPAVLLCDGELTDSQMVVEGYSFEQVWLLYLSCCLLGQVSPEERSKEVIGFLATLVMLGCRRVVSALWQISDQSAAEFSRHWMKALQEHVFNPERPRGPHSFAVAFKEALKLFRQADNGYYDHEYYWAPYLYYGLG